MSDAKFAIIGDFKRINKKNHILFKKFSILLKIIFYIFTLNIKKIKKYINKWYKSNEVEWLDFAGHTAVQASLFRGFWDLKIPFLYNSINNNIDYLILLWAGRKELETVERLKQQYGIKKIATVPTACKYEYDLMYKFANYDFIDFVLCASERTAQYCRNALNNSENLAKILPWPSGVKLADIKDKITPNYSCILFLKDVDVENKDEYFDKNIIKNIEKLGIKCHFLKYGKYNYMEWEKLLKKVDFVIFYQDYCETQGLAMAEAWANGCPTFIKTNYKDAQRNTCPYLSDDAGLFWQSEEELFTILNDYINNPITFLNNFSPYEYAKNNFSDKVSVEKLIEIMQSK